MSSFSLPTICKVCIRVGETSNLFFVFLNTIQRLCHLRMHRQRNNESHETSIFWCLMPFLLYFFFEFDAITQRGEARPISTPCEFIDPPIPAIRKEKNASSLFLLFFFSFLFYFSFSFFYSPLSLKKKKKRICVPRGKRWRACVHACKTARAHARGTRVSWNFIKPGGDDKTFFFFFGWSLFSIPLVVRAAIESRIELAQMALFPRLKKKKGKKKEETDELAI